MFIDTHAHLNFKAYNKNLEGVIDKAKKAGIEKIIIPGAKIDSSRKAVEISQKYTDCFATIGIHPHHVDEFTNLGERNVEEELNLLIKKEKTVAIGEIGLDYHEYKDYPPVSEENKKNQKQLLLFQIELAQKSDLPIIFHCRDAQDDQLELIQSCIQATQKDIRAVFHCFGGEKKHLKKVISLGFFVGFDGNITYPENIHLRNLISYAPLDRILLETDSPYLTPMPFRGKRNDPSLIAYVASCIANLHHKSIEEIAKTTLQNAIKLFLL